MKKDKFVYITCLLCDGTGKIKRTMGFKRTISLEIKKQAFELYKTGLPLRKIADKLGLNMGPQSIQCMINTYIKHQEQEEFNRQFPMTKKELEYYKNL